MVNSVLIMVGVFLWMVNRQFHLRKSKHSYDKEPLRPLKPLKKAKKSSIRVLKKAKRNIVNRVKRKRGVTFVEDTDENAEDTTDEKVSETGKHKIQFKSFSSFLDDVEEDEGEIIFFASHHHFMNTDSHNTDIIDRY